MKLGMVTYNWGVEWDLPTLLKNCSETGYEGVELRTSHRHGVEPTLSAEQRREVRRQFDDSPVRFLGPGTACEFHSPDSAIVAQQIELARKFIVLSHDLGGTGIKVRPNSLVNGEEPQRTVERIARALRECGDFAAGYGQEVRVEVHGKGTSEPAVMKQIMDAAHHEQVVICWNSNPGDVVNGSVERNYNLLKDRLGGTVHINTLYNPNYPYRRLFALLKKQNYQGFCLSESPATSDPLQVMRYYKALWNEMTRDA